MVGGVGGGEVCGGGGICGGGSREGGQGGGRGDTASVRGLLN